MLRALAGYILERLVSFDEVVRTLGTIVEEGGGSLQWEKEASLLVESLLSILTRENMHMQKPKLVSMHFLKYSDSRKNRKLHGSDN